MQPTCFRIHPADNVATLLDDAETGVAARLVNAMDAANATESSLTLAEAIARGHKVAVDDIASGDAVVKYGIPIGRARQPIARGHWVHLHNCASALDERSTDFDPQTGAPRDVPYE
jgi:hypothetical protein